MNIYQKLIEVRKVVPYLKKESQGTQYNYTGSSQVLAAVRAKMDELNLLLIPSVVGHAVRESAIEYRDKDGNTTKRTITYFTELDMTMTWVNADNPEEKIERPWYGQGVDIAGEKGVGKALTYAEKYFILKQFNIATDNDDPDAFQRKYGEEDTPSNKPKIDPEKEFGGSPEKLITQPQLKKISALCTEKKINPEQGKALVEERYKKDSCGQLTSKEASDFISFLQTS